MDSDCLRESIRENAVEIVRLHSRIHEAPRSSITYRAGFVSATGQCIVGVAETFDLSANSVRQSSRRAWSVGPIPLNSIPMPSFT
jgi:hypothetical protein